jgi:hypothetical protein
MTDTTCARLLRAFATLKQQNITPVLVLAGSTGVRDWDRDHYLDAAKRAGTPGRWSGTHVGAEEHGGGYWGADGELYLRYNNQPVRDITWWFAAYECGRALTEALDAEDLPVLWTGDEHRAVELRLELAAAR